MCRKITHYRDAVNTKKSIEGELSMGTVLTAKQSWPVIGNQVDPTYIAKYSRPFTTSSQPAPEKHCYRTPSAQVQSCHGWNGTLSQPCRRVRQWQLRELRHSPSVCPGTCGKTRQKLQGNNIQQNIKMEKTRESGPAKRTAVLKSPTQSMKVTMKTDIADGIIRGSMMFRKV